MAKMTYSIQKMQGDFSGGMVALPRALKSSMEALEKMCGKF
jgi:hypothetical protein